MGCCVSSATTADHKDEPVSGKNTVPPPSVVDEETVVKEVLSETTLLTSSNDDSTVKKTKTIQEDEEKKPGIVVDVAPGPVSTESGSVEPEKGSEICSLSESLLSIVNKYDEEEVKQIKSHVVRQRSPAKSRNRYPTPTRRTEMSPLKRNNEGGGGEEGGGSVRLVPSGTGKRDPTERSERRSRSPAMNRSVVMGPTRSQQSTVSGGATRKISQSPGRVRPGPSKNGSEQDRNHHQWPGSVGNYNSTPNDSFENPLVSLECFIFL